MSDTTTHLLLPYILAAQAQKHVTHNEALRLLDGLVQLSVISHDLTAPPATPADGDRYIVASGATGDWAGWDLNVAQWTDGAWMRLPPRTGWRAWVEDEAGFRVWTGSSWPGLAEASGLLAQAEAVTVALSPSGAATGMAIAEELIADLSGASVDSTVLIPDRAIVLGVSTRTVTAINGATAYDCGIIGEPAMFGGTLGIAAGAANIGVIGPRAFYADTPVRLTASGGSFTGGAVRIAIHYLSCGAPA